MELAQKIKQYYFANFEKLPLEQQFHFASRIASWEGGAEASTALEKLRSYMLPTTDLAAVLREVMDRPPANMFAAELRKPYFQKYPTLFGLHNALFRVRHLKAIYGIDARAAFTQLVPQAELEGLYQNLVNDAPALAILSRFAIDYIFLYEILFDKSECYEPANLLTLKDRYDLDDGLAVHLFIYLVTHAIIADSNFYARPLLSERLATYHKLLEQVEEFVAGDNIKLDNKFEFLVAGRIGGYTSRLAQDINQQASQSLSPEGDYIIDRLVSGGLNSFSGAEHRNVLYIMSASAYQPKSLLR